MPEHLIPIEKARENFLDCAVFLAENINSNEGRAAAMNEVVKHIIDQENVDLAAELADTLDDPYARNKLLIGVISKCVEIGDDEYAFQLIQAIDDFGQQSRAWETIVYQTAKKGDFEKAFKITDNLNHSSHALGDISFLQIQKGLEEEANKTLELIESPAEVVQTILRIAHYFHDQNQNVKVALFLEKAIPKINEIEFTLQKISSFLDVGLLFIEAEQKEKALEMFNQVLPIIESLDDINRDALLDQTAVGFFKADDIDQADSTLDLVADKTKISDCLLSFSEEYRRIGDSDEALECLEESYQMLKSQGEREIRDSQERYKLFALIAAEYAYQGKYERSIEIALENMDPGQRNSALSRIAQIAIFQEKDDFARQALNVIYDDSQRLPVLLTISDIKNNLEKKEESIEYLNEASQLIESIEQFIYRTEAENEIARRFHQIDDLETSREYASKSLQTIGEIKGNGNKSFALAELSDLYKNLKFELSEKDLDILDSITRASEFTG